jgi:integrator complex subunit 7
MSQLVSAATSLRTSPPPAIAAALAAQSRDDLQRCGRVTSQLRQVVKELQECGDSWGRLAASSLDADAATLAQLAVLQQAMVSLARLLPFLLYVVFCIRIRFGDVDLDPEKS